jgi:hypothetical protein
VGLFSSIDVTPNANTVHRRHLETRNEDKYPDPDEFKLEQFFIFADGTLNDDTRLLPKLAMEVDAIDIDANTYTDGTLGELYPCGECKG